MRVFSCLGLLAAKINAAGWLRLSALSLCLWLLPAKLDAAGLLRLSALSRTSTISVKGWDSSVIFCGQCILQIIAVITIQSTAKGRVMVLKNFIMTMREHKHESVKYHTLTEYGGEVAAFAVVFLLVSESFGRLFPLYLFHKPDPPPLDIIFPVKRVENLKQNRELGPGPKPTTLPELKLRVGPRLESKALQRSTSVSLI
ncbi:hypothetical protein EVAR_42721_1 [Eumeta japonica]|uniref:Uncharacterized protein n=1 Tax=Eumeta variegata TaxID=151549 RepID=A0A4C1XKV0_EUMVA|nr:hypothetical protein EVAR_42721_1 [Eumeta japonica]